MSVQFANKQTNKKSLIINLFMTFILFNLIVSNALQFTAVVHILLIATICGAVLHCYALQCHVAVCVFQLNRFISANVSAKGAKKW